MQKAKLAGDLSSVIYLLAGTPAAIAQLIRIPYFGPRSGEFEVLRESEDRRGSRPIDDVTSRADHGRP